MLSFPLVSGVYQAPVGHHEKLEKLSNGTWKLSHHDGNTFTFDTAGKLTSIYDLNGNTVTLTYTSGLLTSVSDPNGRNLTLTYASGKVATAKDYENRTWTFSYHPSGNLAWVQEPTINGQQLKTQYAYDSSGNITTITDHLGNEWAYAYGSNNTFSAYSDPTSGVGGQVTEPTPGSDSNNFNSGTLPAGPEQPDPNPNTYPVDTVVTTYFEDAAGHPGELGMNAQGRVTAIRDGNGNQTNFTYDANNHRTSSVAPGGATTSYLYDAEGNNTKVIRPDLSEITRTYNTQGNITTQTENNNVESYVYDGQGNLISETDPTGITTTYTYDSRGNMTSKTDAAGKTWTYTYNSNGELLRETDPLGNYLENTWSNGRIVSHRDGRGRIVNYTYDAWGRKTGVDNPVSADISLTFDAFDRLTQATDGTGTRTFTYDAAGRKVGQTDPRGNTTAGYDDSGRLLWQTDITGRQINYTYDAAGNLTRVADPTSWMNYTYDTQGRVSTETSSAGVKTFYGYTNGELTSLEHKRVANNSTIIKYVIGYDAKGRRNQITELPSGDVTNFTFDAANRVLTENRTGVRNYSTTYTYNSRGLRATATRYDQGTLIHQGTYTCDHAGRLTQVVDQATQKTETYTWFGDDTLASVNDGTTLRSMEYDEGGSLTKLYRKQGTNPQVLVEEHAYGFDGRRRWTKDYDTSTWTWTPCGVQCEAGELVRLSSNLTGTTWTLQSNSLVGNDEIRRGNAYHLSDTDANLATVVNASATVLDTQLVDSFGAVRSGGTNIGQISSDEFKASAGFAFEPSLGILAMPGRDTVTLMGYGRGGGRGRSGDHRNYGKGKGGKKPRVPKGTPAKPKPKVPLLKRPVPGPKAGIIIEVVKVGACAALYADCIATVDDFMPREEAVCECHKNVREGLKGKWLETGAYFLICTEVQTVLDRYCNF